MNIVRATSYGAGATALSRNDPETGLDLDRVVWDPEYRRAAIELLADCDASSGDRYG